MLIDKYKFYYLSLFIVFSLFGCGGGDTPQIITDDNTSKQNLMKAQLGVLANADVKIFRLEENGSKTLLFSEKTSDGDSFETIGNFNAHIDDLEADKFYIYEVSGGVDKDVNDDGIIDNIPIVNRGKIRLISKGGMLKESTVLPRVTLASQMLYVRASKDIIYNYANLQERLNSYVKDILDSDIDGDGKLDMKDILIFDPVTQKSSLRDSFDIDRLNHQILSHDLSYMNEINASYIIGSYTIDGYYMRDIALSPDETTIYAIGTDYDNRYGLISIDITDKIKPKFYDNLNIKIDNPYGIAVSNNGKKVFVADEYNGLQITDSTDPKNLKPFSSYNENSFVEDVVLSKDNKKAFISIAYGKNSLEIVDITDLDNPRLTGALESQNYSYGLKLTHDENIAFSLSGNNLQIIDLHNLTQPAIISELNTTGYINDIVLSADEKKAFIAEDEAGISVVDLSDIFSPELLTSLNAREDKDNNIANAYKVILSKDEKRLFVAYYAEGIKIIDIQNPHSPKLIKTIKTPGYAQSIALSANGKILYVADESKGLQIIDVSLWSGE